MIRLGLVAALALAAPAYAQECIPRGAAIVTPVQASSTDTVNTVTATIPAVVNKFTFVCGFSITSGGATTASTRAATLVGTGTTLNFAYVDPAGAQGNLDRIFPACLSSSAQNVAMTLTVPGTGTGTVSLSVVMWGCYQ